MTGYSGRSMAFVNLGLCRLRLSDPVGGEAVFPRALPMDRRNSVALLEMGPLRLEAGDTDEAKRYHGACRTVLHSNCRGGYHLVYESPI